MFSLLMTVVLCDNGCGGDLLSKQQVDEHLQHVKSCCESLLLNLLTT